MRDDGEFFKSTFNSTQVFILFQHLIFTSYLPECKMLIQFNIYKISYQGRKGAQTKTGRIGKSNFVETRSFWNLFRTFDRLWTFYLLGLQVFVFNIGKWSCQFFF